MPTKTTKKAGRMAKHRKCSVCKKAGTGHDKRTCPKARGKKS